MMNKNSKTPLATRHIMIVIAGILICLGPCALVYNTWSIFVVPVSSSLGASSSQFTLYITLVYLIGALFSPIAGNFGVEIVSILSLGFVSCFGISCRSRTWSLRILD